MLKCYLNEAIKQAFWYIFYPYLGRCEMCVYCEYSIIYQFILSHYNLHINNIEEVKCGSQLTIIHCN